MKQLFTTAVLLFSATAFAQVGINNTSPKATLDISPKTTDGSKPEGLLIPQLDGNTLKAAAYGTTQKGVIVYAKSAASPTDTKTVNVTAEGYYYFDGSAWQKIVTGSSLNTTLTSGNIYVGNASNVATSVAPTGDVNISNTGVTSIGAGKVTTSQLANNAVTVAKLPTGATGTTFLRGDGIWTTPANIYNTDGALTGPRTVNTAGNTLKISGGGALTVQGSDTAGKILLTPASDATQTGFMSILKGDNTRLGYIGWDNTNLLYKTENGANHIFGGGNVGIGTTTPGNLMEIVSTSSNTGLKLPYGAAAGKVLTSDSSGNSSWQNSNTVFVYSEIHSTGGSTSFPAGTKVNFYHTVSGENVKTVYGNSYGWIDSTQRWITPYTGKFRVTTNMYFNPGSSSNPRLYAWLNSTYTINITSATNTGSNDGTSYTSSIVSLSKGDYIEWKTQTDAVLYGGSYHNFIRVESVE